MAAATTQAQLGTGASVSWANAETGAKFNVEDTLAGTTPIAIPTVTGTNYSWIKNLVLAVTVAGTTNISNRRIAQSAVAATGFNLFWKAVAVGSYAQAASGNQPTASGSNGATPGGYTLMSTTAAVYDNSSISTGSTGPNGSMAVCVLGADNTYTAGASTAAAVPSIQLIYDEA